MSAGLCALRARRELWSRRLPEGGWAYGRSGQISIEASCLASIALIEETVPRSAKDHFLFTWQNTDGSWPAFVGDTEGSWTTALALIALAAHQVKSEATDRAARWLLKLEGREAHWLWRWKFKLVDTRARFDPDKYGWPWTPAANSWVIPTALALIALKQFSSSNPSVRASCRIQTGVQMLFDRACIGGGWNAGNSVVDGVALAPHIEETADALMSLQDEPLNSIILGGQEWLRRRALGLAAVSSLAWSILSLFLFDIPVEALKSRLAARLEDPSQIRDNGTLAVAILALQCAKTSHPFAVVR